MADYRHIIPFIFHYEDAVPLSWADRPLQEQFGRAKELGLVILPFDKGGPTVCGVTYSTYTLWCKSAGRGKPTVEQMVTMSLEDWLGVYKSLFWDKIRGDGIGDQGVADMLVDWCWTSGVPWPVRRLQGILHVKQDGIVGPKTLYELNCWNGDLLVEEMRKERIDYYEGIAKRDPNQKRFLKGWINRTNDCAKWKKDVTSANGITG